MYFVTILVLLTVGVLSGLAYNNEVPMVLWNIKGSSLHLRPVSAFEISTKKTMENLLEETMNDGSTSILAFVVDRLSMEDFSVDPNIDASNNTLKTLEAHLDKSPHMLLPSVIGPMKQLRTLPCSAEDIYVDHNVNEKVKTSISSAVDRSCVVFVHLPNFGIVFGKVNDHIFQPSFQSKKNVIGVFTGQKSSWDVTGEKHHRTRSLLEVKEASDHFMKIGNCTIMYAESVVVKIGDKDNSTKDLPFPPTVDGTCTNSMSSVQLTFGQVDDISQVVLKFEFEVKRGSWYMANGTVKITGGRASLEEEEAMKSNPIEAPVGFSFSCGKFTIRPGNITDVIITIERFQVELTGQQKFSESFDCVPFFTLPIWMGIIVALFFIVIINSGIYALFAIKTMDRFDDPKGKTISVPLGAE